MDYNTLKELVDQGLSSRQMAEQFNCSSDKILKLLKKNNLKTKISEERENKIKINYEQLKALIDQSLSNSKIAETLNCSEQKIRYWSKKFNLKTQYKRPKIPIKTEKLCKKCGIILPIDKFHSGGRPNKYQTFCKTCQLKKQKLTKRSFKIQLIDYKGGKCQSCGYNRYAGALSFPRIDFKKRKLTSGVMHSKSLKEQKEEVDKCVLVCFNCYREIKFLKEDTSTHKACKVGSTTYYRKKIKTQFVNDKGGKCQVCGYDKYIGSLDFHHIDPSTKKFNISSEKVSDEKRKEELNKCILVCANCHAEVHGGLINVEKIGASGET